MMYLSLKRILFPRALALMFLGGFFYFGIYLNLKILNISVPSEYHVYILGGIGVLLVLQGVLNYLKFTSYRYLFYKDRMIFQGKKDVVILYGEIQNLVFKRDFLDNLFNTGSIDLIPKHKMKYIENTNQVYFYVQKLIQYHQQTAGAYAQQYPQQPYYQQQVR